MQFNERVLAEARLSTNPLLERTKFLAITAANLDEFFMIRIASLARKIQNLKKTDPKQEVHSSRIRENLLAAVAKFAQRQADTLDLLTAALQPAKIFISRKAKPDTPPFELGRKVFAEQILPNLSAPEAFSVQQLSGLENLQMGAAYHSNFWFRIPRSLPHVYLAPKGDETYVFFLDDLLISHLPAAFNLKSPPVILRLTRDGDLRLDLEKEDAESIPDFVKTSLRVRDKGKPVRLQYLGSLPPELHKKCVHYLKLLPGQIYPAPASLGLQGLWTLANYAKTSADPSIVLKSPAFKPFIPKAFKNLETVFDQVRERDYLFHHPYDSFDAFVAWIKAACEDPKVVRIEQTVYRVDALSPIMGALKAAAKKKKIRVMIELRARFDEMNNLQLSDELRNAGVEVGFGLGKLKLHAKVALVTRIEDGVERLYTHLSTGNYNATTAQTYTDLALLTANPDFGADARHFFDTIWTGKGPTQFKQLVSAPLRLHKKLLSLIESEIQAAKAGRSARIVAKANALVDEVVIEKLYEASTAGVKVDLIIRGACSLIPGVKGLSENIRVISIVDRYLEHSRIYYFGDSKSLYLSSADWMPRNFFSRLELAFPILDPRIYDFIVQVVIPTYLSDTVKAKELSAEGVWKKRSATKLPDGPALQDRKNVRAQSLFEELAASAYRGATLSNIDFQKANKS